MYQLLLNAPVIVASHERTFGRLKLTKTYLRSAMTYIRLVLSMLMLCEKDLTDNVDIEPVVHAWSNLKSRRVTIDFLQMKKDE